MIAVRTLKPPLPPMEALLTSEIPVGDEWQYEPKWDGFRCLAFRNGRSVRLQSKASQFLERYFPEVVEALLKLRAERFVLDGELVVIQNQRLSFDDLLQRIHPAASRIRKLARETPVTYIVFDLLSDEHGRSLLHEPLLSRRPKLEAFARRFLKRNKSIWLSPMTRDLRQARKWFNSGGAALDGVIAKRLDMDYRSGERTGMQKSKRRRTAECVVGGFRYGSKLKLVGSLLLGLYDRDGLLHHVGFTSSIKKSQRAALTKKLEALIRSAEKGGGFTGRAPGGPSRWSTERSGEWQPVQPKLVLEVEWDHFTGGRFRHGTKFLRWRPDKPPRDCTLDQVSRRHASISRLFAAKS